MISRCSLFFSIILFAIPVFGEQCSLIQKRYAEKAVSFLEQSEKIMYFCQPCGDTVPRPDVVRSAKVSNVNGTNLYSVYLEGRNSQQGIDLANVYIKSGTEKKPIFKNLGILSGCRAEDVPYAINSEGPLDAKMDTSSTARTVQPKTVCDFFELLPQWYFTLDECDSYPTKKNCDRARAKYLKKFLEVEDTANGYMKGGCDFAQECFHMALFKRPDGTYLIGLTTYFELCEDSYFLEYVDGRWHDVGTQVVPEYGRDKAYELPRYGTTVEVYEIEQVEGDIYRERGRKLYDMTWKNGTFAIKK